MIHAPRGWACAALLAVGPALSAEPSEVLLSASHAASQASYRGVVVYRDARTLEVMRIVHRRKDGQVQERLTSLTGAPRDVMRDGDRLSCLVAGEAAMSTTGLPQSLFPAFSPTALERLGHHYELRDTGESRVAGRSCRGVAMAPRDAFRYGYEVCADTQTGVPLKVSLVDRQGQPVEQMVFTEVAFPAAIADSEFRLPAGARPTAQPAAARVAAPAAWQLARLPPGFEVIARRPMPGDGTAVVEHVVLSDGVSAVSVFGGPLPAGRQPLQGTSQLGATSAYGRAVGTFHVTVVGEVPESTVRLIGDGFRPQPPATASR